MILLACGDVCGESGLRIAGNKLRPLKKFYGTDVCVVNGENADVMGLRPEQAQTLFEAGADVVTLGNHVWNRQQIIPELRENPYLLRPLNLAGQAPGEGAARLLLRSGRWLTVACLLGRLNCEWNADNPFRALDALIKTRPDDLFAIDFHAEATSEKTALAFYVDGRVSAVFGTHTHVQTADAFVSAAGTASLTDLGLCGVERESVLGMDAARVLKRFITGLPHPFIPARGEAVFNGALVEVNKFSGKALSIRPVRGNAATALC